jgi:DNA-binding Xre family transcriptional regulator
MAIIDLSEKTGITLANLSILKTGKARAIRVRRTVSVLDLALRPTRNARVS